VVPKTPVLKNSIVDVRCTDRQGRQFIVEMQMSWTASFEKRVLFNASKAYVQQLKRGITYRYLQPVYALSIVNEIAYDTEDFYHHYQMVCDKKSKRVLDDLQLLFIELPKFRPQSLKEKRMAVLWLRFLKEMDGEREESEISEDLKNNPIIREALETLKESSFTREELQQYDRYFDAVSSERTFLEDSYEKGRVEERQRAKEKMKSLEREKQKAEEEKQKAEEEKQKAKEEKQKAEEEKQKAEEEKQKAELKSRVLELYFVKGLSKEALAEELGIDLSRIEELLP
jgi:predicted transposase/invertase (TIGR01784 family)